MKQHILTSLLSLFLLGCSNDNSDLVRYIQKVKQRKTPEINPSPAFIRPPIFLHPKNSNRRNPFQRKKRKADSKSRCVVSKYATSYPLESLKFVGTLERGKQIQGLIMQPDSKIILIHEGEYMGRNLGRVLEINNQQIKWEKTIKNSSERGKKHIVFLKLNYRVRS